MAQLQTVLSQMTVSDRIQLLGVMSATFVPLLVLVVTNFVQGRRHREVLARQKEQFDRQLMVTKNGYEGQIDQARTSARIEHMPFLHLEKEASFSLQNGRIVIQLWFTNLGNGVALEARVPFGGDLMREPLLICCALTSLGKYPCRYTAPFSVDVVPVGAKTSFALIIDAECVPDSGEFHFGVRFTDALHNRYQQKYFFQFLGDTALRVESGTPELEERPLS